MIEEQIEALLRAHWAGIGRKGGQAKSERKTAANRLTAQQRAAGKLSDTPAAVAARARRAQRREAA